MRARTSFVACLTCLGTLICLGALAGCLPTAPPPMVSPTATAVVASGPTGQSVFSQRAGAEVTTEATFLESQLSHRFGSGVSAHGSVSWAQGWYEERQRGTPETVEYRSGEQVLGAMAWLLAGRGGTSVEVSSPLYLHAGLSYGRGDQDLAYMSFDAAASVEGHFADNMWGGLMIGGGYTHLFDPGNPVYVNSRDSADFEQIERLSTGFFLTSMGLGAWLGEGERVGWSADLSMASPMTTDEDWGASFFMAFALGLHIRLGE
ncbi:hypothetical protein FIV42_16055 [Persicimonas caeni]|uniref:Autotransporter outer membrane beta-barrel domain-containing protein n=1 Tax=Persicimonas caeni TaxID=2292766 RepID=A0A4Y6PVQ7_PERCE|nr:hypothetical protein [Persicimonas caeni]QDG52199.1 hypothetical protein FIV42_16055 [Persicimonas caeni]QED33421.1 hypothetical protein FRD00_16050 [Persicimonas caeni]